MNRIQKTEEITENTELHRVYRVKNGENVVSHGFPAELDKLD